MPIAFSRTTHALHNEPYHFVTQLGMVVAIAIMLFWCVWFFYGSIYHYVGSKSVSITLESQPVWRILDGQHKVKGLHQYKITAYFTTNDAQHIHAKQIAALYVKDDNTLPARPFKLVVHDVNVQTGVVHLKLELEQKLNDTQSRLEIAVMRQSPAKFLFHTVSR